MTCPATSMPNGMNKDCIKALKEAVAALVYQSGSSTFANVSALDNIENMRVKIQEDETCVLIPLQGSEVTAGEIQESTTGYGDTAPTGVNAPMLTGHAKTNACDFLEYLKAFSGSTYKVMYFDADGQIICYNDGSNLYGFTTSIQAQPFGLGSRDGQESQFQIKFYFRDANEASNYKIVPVNYSLNQLLLLAPVGLTADEATGFTAGTVVVDISTRCTGTELIETLTAEVVSTNVVGSAVTVVPTYNAANLNYDVVFLKDAVQLDAGDYVVYRLVSKTGDVYDKVSNTLKATA